MLASNARELSDMERLDAFLDESRRDSVPAQQSRPPVSFHTYMSTTRQTDDVRADLLDSLNEAEERVISVFESYFPILEKGLGHQFLTMENGIDKFEERLHAIFKPLKYSSSRWLSQAVNNQDVSKENLVSDTLAELDEAEVKLILMFRDELDANKYQPRSAEAADSLHSRLMQTVETILGKVKETATRGLGAYTLPMNETNETNDSNSSDEVLGEVKDEVLSTVRAIFHLGGLEMPWLGIVWALIISCLLFVCCGGLRNILHYHPMRFGWNRFN